LKYCYQLKAFEEPDYDFISSSMFGIIKDKVQKDALLKE